MALSSIIYKVDLQVTDMDRNYYQDHQLVIARHPSESNERMMVRLLAFALHASASMQFCKGISADDEPDVWQKSLSGEIEVWIDLGQPDAKRIRKACGRSKQVIIYTYLRSHAVWWQQVQNKLSRFDNLTVIHLSSDTVAGLGAMAARAMRLQCTIQDGSLWLTGGDQALEIMPEIWKENSESKQ